MPSFSHHPSSYRDPSGFIFYWQGELYRQVNKSFEIHFTQFIEGGLYEELVKRNLLIPHEAISQNLTGSEQWFRTLKPEYIDHISYPYEWSFEMLKDAALLTLEVANVALKKNMVLKDATAYNVQMHKGKMIFIDSLSFEIYDETKPWIAYKQFCEQFFAPLALAHYLKLPMHEQMLAYPDGIPLQVAKKMLPFKSKWNLHTYLNIHLHSTLTSKSPGVKQEKRFSKQKFQNLLRSLKEGIESFSFDQPSGVWSGYYNEAFNRDEYIDHKKQVIAHWIKELEWQTAFDAGANEGEFSLLLMNKARYLISADLDHFSINNLYKKIKKDHITNIYPLLVDLSHPSPAIGVNNEERAAFIERTKVDLVMALALIHHLCIGKNIPFDHIAEMFSRMGKNLLIEFVPRQDEKTRFMLEQKQDIYTDYHEQSFTRAFEKYFTIISKQSIRGSGRTLYLMKAHAI